jgi:hypothetical protein
VCLSDCRFLGNTDALLINPCIFNRPRRPFNLLSLLHYYWAWGSVVVKALRYKSDGPGIDSRWCHWIFQWHISFRPYHGPGVDSAPAENEYQEHFMGVKAAGAWGWRPYHLHVPNVMKSGSLNLLEPSGPHQTWYGTPFTFTLLQQINEMNMFISLTQRNVTYTQHYHYSIPLQSFLFSPKCPQFLIVFLRSLQYEPCCMYVFFFHLHLTLRINTFL